MTKPLEDALLQLNPVIVDPKEDTINRYADLKETFGDFVSEEFAEVRRLMAVLKNYFGPNVMGDMHWTGLVFQEVVNLREAGHPVAISGVQHQHELDQVRKHDGVTVWINRPIKRRIGDTAISAKDCDVVVDNNGNLRDFYANIVEGLEEYNSRMNG